MSQELISHDNYDGPRIMFRQDWFDSGLSDHAASCPARPVWGDPYDQRERTDNELTLHSAICERLLRPDRGGLPPSAAQRAHLTKTMTAIRLEITRRTQEPQA